MEIGKAGVFSPCLSMDSASMIKCLQALLSKHPSIKFDSISSDKKNKGFKILFTEPEDSIVLRKNLLSSEDHPLWIYPLTTYLMIHGVDHKKSPLFERDLRDAIAKKFGKVIQVLKTPITNHSNNWRIEIDTPEFKGNEVFQSKRNTFYEIPLAIPGRNETVTLKFWCRQCDSVGHFQHECLARGKKNTEGPKIEEDENVSRIEQGGDYSTDEAGSSPDRNSRRISQKVLNFALETTEQFAKKIGEEEVMSKHVQNDITENTERIANNNLLTENEIKREATESAEVIDTSKSFNSGSKNSELLGIIRGSNLGSAKKTRDTSSDDDDDIRVIEYTNNSPSNISPTRPANGYGGGSNVEEESVSLPESKDAMFQFPSLPGTSLGSPGSSLASANSQAFATLKTPRGAEVTTALSERLQECINQVCEATGVLDRKKLDAFLIHVKKKSNPIRVALNYTANTKGLKEQLKGILHMYYNTPQTGTKEDIQFIKWLNGLVERYDGSIPKKRKRSGKADDEPFYKRN